MKLLFTITSLGVGGAETFLAGLCNWLATRHEVSVFAASPARADSVAARFSASVRIWHGGDVRARSRSALLRAAHFLQQVSPPGGRTYHRIAGAHVTHLARDLGVEVLASNLFHADYATRIAARNTGLPWVVMDHGDYRAVLPVFRPAAARILRDCAVIVAPSVSNISALRHLVPEGKAIELIYYGLAPAPAPGPRDALRAELGASPEDTVFLMAGRGIAEKGWREASDAFVSLPTQLQQRFWLWFAGTGSFLDELKRTLPTSARDRIRFLGHRPDVANLAAAADIGVFPSVFASESLPMFVIECLSRSLPVIASDAGGIPEMLCVGETTAGTLLHRNTAGQIDAKDLAAAMVTMASDDESRARHRRAATEAFQRFSIETCGRAYEALFERLAAS